MTRPDRSWLRRGVYPCLTTRNQPECYDAPNLDIRVAADVAIATTAELLMRYLSEPGGDGRALIARIRALDPRLYQIGSLAALLLYGMNRLEFDISAGRAGLIILTALLTQYICTQAWRLPKFDPRSALISALSLCLLLRSNLAAVAVIAAVITIASKFVLRWRGKHIFNPTNFGIVAMLLLTDTAWVSPAQWGTTTFLAFLFACMGGLVVNRAARSDVTYAFLFFWLAILFGRSLWLGEPMSIPLHRLQSGALLLFAFFMISDPRTTPNSRAGRIVFALLVSIGAWYVQFKLFRTNGLLWSLALFSATVPAIDALFPGERYQWAHPQIGRLSMKATAASLLVLLLFASPAHAFCGFYVAKADTKLFNKASQVAIVRNGDRTVMTMANDYQGELKEFAIVIPVPTVLQRGQIHVGDKALLDRLDAYSAPRLVEYFDPDPCAPIVYREMMPMPAAAAQSSKSSGARAKSLGITIEAQYTVGEYDILILSAKQSDGLETWLNESGYRVPPGASKVLGSYIRQNMKFFVARVNLKEQAKLGFSYLRPIQVAYNSPKFMLPIRLGTVNANGTQEIFIYVLSRNGRVETTNYRTVKLPSDAEVPLFVKNEFGDFYKSMFSEQVRRNGMAVVFLEYAWNMAWCDPCAADPLTYDELKKLGVFWLADSSRMSQAQDVFLTRLHARYDGAHFPEDLVFQETGDKSNYQGRYILRHPWKGSADCPAAKEYRTKLRQRQEKEAQTLANLTGWDINRIRTKMNIQRTSKPVEKDEKSWWETLWE